MSSVNNPKPQKLHAACDSCRTRKLKCSGTPPRQCERCLHDGIDCVYSPTMKMGRPRKRKMVDIERDGTANYASPHENNIDTGGSVSCSNNDLPMPNSTLCTPPSSSISGKVSSALPLNTDIQFDVNFLEDPSIEEIMTANFGNRVPTISGSTPSLPQNLELGSPNQGLFHDVTLQEAGGDAWDVNIAEGSAPLWAPLEPQTPDVQQSLTQGEPSPFTNNLFYPPVDPSPSTQLSITNFNVSIPSSLPPLLTPTCACLSSHFLTMSTLQSLQPIFPNALPHLRNSINTTLSILQCPTCPKSPVGAIQNVFYLTALLTIIAERFHRLLENVEEQHKNDSCTSEIRRVELVPGTNINVELKADEWRNLAKRAIKAEIMNPVSGNPTSTTTISAPSNLTTTTSSSSSHPTSLLAVIAQMESRQSRWHTSTLSNPRIIKMWRKDKPSGLNACGNLKHSGESEENENPHGKKKSGGNMKAKDEKSYLCLKMLTGIRDMVEAMGL